MVKKRNKESHYILWLIFVIIALALIIFILLPSINCEPVPADRVVCFHNLKQLGLAIYLYHNDNGKLWPITEKWYDLIKPYSQDKDKKYFQCPKDKTGPCSYAMNKNIPADANDLPPDLVLLFESAPGWNQTGGPEDVVIGRHDKNNPGAEIAFADGSVKFVKAEEIPKLRWTIEQK